MRSDALIALTRFGLGPKPGELRDVGRDPRGFCLAQLDDPAAGEIDGLMNRDAVLTYFAEVDEPFTQARMRLGDGATDDEEMARLQTRKARGRAFRELDDEELGARFSRGVTTGKPLVERLVLFWSNHFAIDKKRNKYLRVLAGNFEREAIRPFVLGNFEDMLFATTLHPAMLQYLDNDRSIAPGSRLGMRRGVTSPNENLARELLELHTLGAGSGYTQADVQQVALILAGWTGGFHPKRREVFEVRFHDAAPRTVLGTTYPAAGQEQIELLLPDLANNPRTARHIAQKFARHFVGDLAPASLVEALERSFNDTGGDLAELTRTLVAHDGAWVSEAYKTVPPYDFTVAAARALGRPDLSPTLVGQAVKDLAQDVWAPPSPAGWPDDDRAFLGGDSMLERIDFAAEIVERTRDLPDVRDLAANLFGDDLAPQVAEAIARAEDRRQAGVLLLMSPAFQRR